MITFLTAAVIVFVLCWIWVGGYIADFVIWIISKFVSSESNEKTIAVIIGAVAAVLGVVIALLGIKADNDVSSALGGFVLGVGAYIAVRLPRQVRRKRAREEAKQASMQQPPQTGYSLNGPAPQPWQTPMPGPVPPSNYGSTPPPQYPQSPPQYPQF